MSDDTPTGNDGNAQQTDSPAAAATGGGGGRQFGLRVNEAEMQTHYANAFRVHTTTDEVLVDLGFNMVTVNRQPNPDPKAPAGTVQLDWSQRAIVNYRTAKGLAIELGRVIRAYEDRFGEIKPPAPAGTADPAGQGGGA